MQMQWHLKISNEQYLHLKKTNTLKYKLHIFSSPVNYVQGNSTHLNLLESAIGHNHTLCKHSTK